MRTWTFFLLSFLFVIGANAQPASTISDTDELYLPSVTAIPTAGNTWATPKIGNEDFDGNIIHWKNVKTIYNSYFRTASKGLLTVKLHAKISNSNASLKLSLDKKPFPLTIKNQEWETIYVGAWVLKDTGYHTLQFQILHKDSLASIDIDSIYISGSASQGELVFVPNNEGNFHYWGRRGPSVHLNYVTDTKDIAWFYNEVTVPVGQDPIGSYFMADGFSVGYFGFQVNSADTRHVLFSVWSPFSTDNPNAIPADQKITLLKKGTDVHVGEFGNEGSGGQSYLNYPWKAGRTYKFLLHAQPNKTDSTTDFTAYFYAPEKQKWLLIASFRRPHTSTYLSHIHSFLENFDPEMGNITRNAQYGNQWVKAENGEWQPISAATFSVDNTGRKNYRKDYSGGTNGNQFYLKNGGFFNQFTPYGTRFEIENKLHIAPQINFEQLP